MKSNYCMNIIYFVLILLAIASLVNFSNDYFHRFSLFIHILLFSNLFISSYSFIVLKYDPGIVKQTSHDFSNIQENTIISDTNSHYDDLREEFRSYCNICNVYKPLRAKHCSKCGVCVRKYDRHCLMIGGCVGEKNHLKFIIFINSQTITLYIAIYEILDTISFYLDNTGEKYFKVPIILYILLIIFLFYFVFCFVILVFNFFLIFTNQTTYEIFHKSSLNYIVKYREIKKNKLESIGITVTYNIPFQPFDMGIRQNLKFLYYNNEEYDWYKYYYENLQNPNTKFNLCDNQYWSCF